MSASESAQHGQTYRIKSALTLTKAHEPSVQEYVNRTHTSCPFSLPTLALQEPRTYQLF